jgi:hypothetical protein
MRIFVELRRLVSSLRRSRELPADPFGEPGPGFAQSDSDRDLGGLKFTWIINRM